MLTVVAAGTALGLILLALLIGDVVLFVIWIRSVCTAAGLDFIGHDYLVGCVWSFCYNRYLPALEPKHLYPGYFSRCDLSLVRCGCLLYACIILIMSLSQEYHIAGLFCMGKIRIFCGPQNFSHKTSVELYMYT